VIEVSSPDNRDDHNFFSFNMTRRNITNNARKPATPLRLCKRPNCAPLNPPAPSEIVDERRAGDERQRTAEAMTIKRIFGVLSFSSRASRKFIFVETKRRATMHALHVYETV